jgi:hypothetical protein
LIEFNKFFSCNNKNMPRQLAKGGKASKSKAMQAKGIGGDILGGLGNMFLPGIGGHLGRGIGDALGSAFGFKKGGKLVKGSKEAKAYMASLRAMRK